MTDSIQQIINSAIALERQQERKEPSGKYYPSGFGMCYRAQFLNRKNIEKSNAPDERVLRVFKAGNLFESFVTNLILREYPSASTQVLCEEEDIKGYADLVKENEAVEIKSQHSKAFWYMNKYQNLQEVREAKYHNFMQCAYYAKKLDKEFLRLVYISKDDLCIKEYVDKYEGYWQNELEKELKMLRLIWRIQEVPPALPRRWKKKDGTYSECKYCDYYDFCKALGDCRYLENDIKQNNNKRKRKRKIDIERN